MSSTTYSCRRAIQATIEQETCPTIFDTANNLKREYPLVDGWITRLPWEFLQTATQDLNGDYGSNLERDANGRVQSYDLWYSFKIKMVETNPTVSKSSYHWHQITTFLRCGKDASMSFVLCIDFPPSMRKQLHESLTSYPLISLPGWHAIILEAVKGLYNQSVWRLRDFVRDAECLRGSKEMPQSNFVHLHEISRHIIHSNETLDVANETIRCIQNHQEKLAADFQVQDRLFAIGKQMKDITRRSQSLHERLQNEINLAFNLVAQKDSQIMIQAADNSLKDSYNMKFIAVVGLLYLPGTFVSGLFGMNFFDFKSEPGGQSWAVSDSFWLYWAITGPLTLATVLVWVAAFHGSHIKQHIFS